MRTFDIIMYILAIICFVIAALTYGLRAPATGPGRPLYAVHLVALGLAFWVLVPLVTLINA
jgi:uncharacterized membrane protein YhhN